MFRIKDYCTKEIVKVNPSDTFKDVLNQFLNTELEIGCVISGSGKLEGIISKNSILREIMKGVSINSPILPNIRKNVVTIDANAPMDHARDIMLLNKVAHGVVVDEKNLVLGVVSKADIIRGFLHEKHLLVNQLSNLISHLEVAVISINSEGIIETFNPAAEQILGINNNNSLGEEITSTIPEISNNLYASLHNQELKKLDRITYKDKTLIASYIPISNKNQQKGAMAVLQDITTLETFAKELEYTKKLKQTLGYALSLSYDAIVILDENGYVTDTNDATLDLFEIQDELVGHHWFDKVKVLDIKKVLSGKRVESNVKTINGKMCIVNQEPIFQSEKICGAIIKIIYRQIDDWKDIIKRIEILENEVNFYKDELQKIAPISNSFDRIISKNRDMDRIKRHAFLASDSVSTVLIQGESGTGKELFAEAIHRESKRIGEFVKINCAAIPAELLESELFGYVDGAFTGAKRGGKKGRFELANNGTLFLDEIGDMSLPLLAKILRVLQERSFERIGDLKTQQVDVRIIAATHKNLKQMVLDGTFREDLYYRIDVVSFLLPPLRDRLDDLPLLCNYLIKKLNKKLNKNVQGITSETLIFMEKYGWPGNVRQLENVLERAMNLGVDRWIEPLHLPKELTQYNKPTSVVPSAAQQISGENTLDEIEKQAIMEILKKTNFNRSEAAKQLGISRSGLYKKLKKYGIRSEMQFHS